jgi:WD40 repeat protein
MDGLVVIWNVAKWERAASPFQLDDTSYSLAISPDGATLAAGDMSGKIWLWDLATLQPIGVPLAGAGFSDELVFSPDGSRLASGNIDGTIEIWDVSPESWRERACRIANRDLTEEEWERYLGDRPYRSTCGAVLNESKPASATPAPPSTPASLTASLESQTVRARRRFPVGGSPGSKQQDGRMRPQGGVC